MRLLHDTNALFWWLIDEARLSLNARSAIGAKDNEVYVSVASAWEMAIKVGIGKWPEAQALLGDFEGLDPRRRLSTASNLRGTCP